MGVMNSLKTSSQSYYRNFLNHDKEEGLVNIKSRTNATNRPQDCGGSPCNLMDNYLRAGKTMKTKKSFLRVEESRKSKQFREGKIPTNTSFSGMEKCKLKNFGLKNYETRKTQYQSKNKSFDLISYHSKKKSKASKRNNCHSFYYNVNELLKNAAPSNSKSGKSKKRKTAGDGKNGPLRASTFNKRQRFNKSSLKQRRSVTTTRGVDISPQARENMSSDIRRPTSSS